MVLTAVNTAESVEAGSSNNYGTMATTVASSEVVTIVLG